MKKLLLSLIFSLNFMAAQAQAWVYHPFPTDSAVWNTTRGTYNVTSCCPPVVDYYPEAPDRYCLYGTDTLIGSYTYSKVYYCGAAYKGGLRDDSLARKVYFVPADSLNELLIYDFSVQAGDTAFVYEQIHYGDDFHPAEYTYISIDSVMINGNYRKRINFGSEPGMWIEGIGCTQGLFREAWANVSNWYNSLECMSESDWTLYPSTSLGPCSLVSGINDQVDYLFEIELFPNPTNGKFQIKTEVELSQIQITDVLGKIIYQAPLKSTHAEIDLTEKIPGLYFVRFSDTKGNILVKKIIKQ